MLQRFVAACAIIGQVAFWVLGAASVSALAATGQQIPEYILGTGDKIRITVFGEKDLTGDFEVSDQGYIAFPLIGQIVVKGQTPAAVENLLTAKLSAEYLVDPKVNVEVLNYRPFYIIGEVKSPGQYPYVNGMRIVNAVALAGGYTPRASKGTIYVKHADKGDKTEVPMQEDEPIVPGDVIRVAERFF